MMLFSMPEPRGFALGDIPEDALTLPPVLGLFFLQRDSGLSPLLIHSIQRPGLLPPAARGAECSWAGGFAMP